MTTSVLPENQPVPRGASPGRQTCLVTGGGGFLGRAIIERLLTRGWRVRSLSRSRYPELESLGVDCISADITDVQSLRRACDGCTLVFHAAAKAGLAGSYAAFHRPNVLGAEAVLAASRAAGVTALVYTSSPSVVFDGRDQENLDESAPYSARFAAHYPRTKAIAEQSLLNANGPALRTLALRPHLIWGPRDNHIVPRILARARRLRRIGSENKLVDSTYIDNAADAHLLAADALLNRPETCAGRPYFITNGDPRPTWDLINAILAAANLPPVTRAIPKPLARLAAAGCEAAYWLLNRSTARRQIESSREPPLTHFLVDELTTAHWFNISAARRDLHYEPRISIDEGLRRLSAWLNKA